MGMPEHLINRHPFPGPGLAVRILGDITREKVRVLQEADDIFIRGLRDYKIRMDVDQARRVLAAGVPAGAPRHGEIEVSLYDQVWRPTRRTSSLKSHFSGSQMRKFIFSGSPPTLW